MVIGSLTWVCIISHHNSLFSDSAFFLVPSASERQRDKMRRINRITVISAVIEPIYLRPGSRSGELQQVSVHRRNDQSLPMISLLHKVPADRSLCPSMPTRASAILLPRQSFVRSLFVLKMNKTRRNVNRFTMPTSPSFDVKTKCRPSPFGLKSINVGVERNWYPVRIG